MSFLFILLLKSFDVFGTRKPTKTVHKIYAVMEVHTFYYGNAFWIVHTSLTESVHTNNKSTTSRSSTFTLILYQFQRPWQHYTNTNTPPINSAYDFYVSISNVNIRYLLFGWISKSICLYVGKIIKEVVMGKQLNLWLWHNKYITKVWPLLMSTYACMYFTLGIAIRI